MSWVLASLLVSAAMSPAQVVITNVPGLGGTMQEARGLNRNGMVAGFARTFADTNQHAFIFSGGETHDLGGNFSLATGINAAGQISGESTLVDTGDSHAFLFALGGNTDLGTLGGTFSTANAINDSGQVVGASDRMDGQQRAFLYTGGVMTDLGTLGGNYSSAAAINNAGQVAGQSATSNDMPHAFLYSAGTMIDLGTLGGASSAANVINSLGQVAGTADTTNESHAFFYHNGTMNEIGTLGGTSSSVNGINDSGQVVGDSTLAGNLHSHAFLYSNGSISDLGTLGGDSSALAINNLGQIVGRSVDTNGVLQAILWRNGSLVNLNDLLPADSGWILNSATLISDSGQIVGFGTLHGVQSWFLLTLPANRPPVANAGPDRTHECAGTVTLNGSGSFSPDGSALTYEWREKGVLLATGVAPSVALALGVHTIVLTVRDTNSVTDQDEVIITLVDTFAPFLVCADPLRLSAGPGCQVAVPDFLTALNVQDNCTPRAQLILTQDPAAGTLVSTGSLVITVRATDSASNTSTCTSVLIVTGAGSVIDSISASPRVLEHPDGSLRPVTLSVSASSICGGAPGAFTCRIVSITSNEPVTGPGGDKASPDWVITGDLTALLRADRVPRYKHGRIYMLRVRCTDISGNSVEGTTAVFVPRK
jgi:probable HAF family extracellular repeat protein